MRFRWLFTWLTWAVTLAGLAGVLAVGYFVHQRMQQERASEEGEGAVAERRVKDGVVHLGSESAERWGIEPEPARAVQWRPQVVVYGQVVINPGRTVEVRSPFGGTLRADDEADWPVPGQEVRAGQVLGWIDIRVGPQERLTLQHSLDKARLDVQGAREIVQIQQGRVDRLRPLTSDTVIERGQLDAALVQLAEAKTRLETSRAAVALWEQALAEIDRHSQRNESRWSQRLVAPAGGEVTELAARPGMAIEAGGLVARVADFRQPRVRLDVPPDLLAGGPPRQVQLLAPAATSPGRHDTFHRPPAPTPPPSVEAVLAGPAPRVDETSQFVSYWYDVRGLVGEEKQPALWRPGLQVRALMHDPAAEPQPAVAVPGTALLYHDGRTLVYVCLAPGQYQRREVRPLGREGGDWVLARRQEDEPAGLMPEEEVVTRQAQVLLSEEFRGIVVDDD